MATGSGWSSSRAWTPCSRCTGSGWPTPWRRCGPAELAFTDDEAITLIEASGTTLRPESATRLVALTRGWAVGLRFAALHLGDADDPDRAVDGLAGDSGNIAAYLMSEVLQTLPPHDRELLLRTSVVDVLRPGLCEALGGRRRAAAWPQLAHANVLVEAVSGRPGWFRYHPFLMDLLRAELAFASPRLTRRLSRRAARWYADEGILTQAVTHAAASRWWADAAAYAVDGLAVAELVVGDDTDGLVRALRELPHDVTGPHAAVARAALGLSRHDLLACDRELARVRAARERSRSEVDPALDLAVAAVETGRAGRRRLRRDRVGAPADRPAGGPPPARAARPPCPHRPRAHEPGCRPPASRRRRRGG